LNEDKRINASIMKLKRDARKCNVVRREGMHIKMWGTESDMLQLAAASCRMVVADGMRHCVAASIFISLQWNFVLIVTSKMPYGTTIWVTFSFRQQVGVKD
jgi:hypothetical protein